MSAASVSGRARRDPSAEDWNRLDQEHAASIEDFTARAESVADALWPTSVVPGKWSPAQVAEHIALAYEAILRDLSGGPAMRLRASWWQRVLLRRFLLPRILTSGRIPFAATAPREARPGGEPLDRAEVLRRVREGASRLDAVMRESGESARVTHPYFGTLRGREILRFCAIHTRHHAFQLGGGPPTADGAGGSFSG